MDRTPAQVQIDHEITRLESELALLPRWRFLRRWWIAREIADWEKMWAHCQQPGDQDE